MSVHCLFVFKLMFLFSRDAFNWSKVMVIKIYISNKCLKIFFETFPQKYENIPIHFVLTLYDSLPSVVFLYASVFFVHSMNVNVAWLHSTKFLVLRYAWRKKVKQVWKDMRFKKQKFLISDLNFKSCDFISVSRLLWMFECVREREK